MGTGKRLKNVLYAEPSTGRQTGIALTAMRRFRVVSRRKIRQAVEECFRKKRYNSENLAVHVQRKVWKDRKIQLRVYYCPHCFGFHLTRKVKK